MSRVAIFALVLALSAVGCAGREAASRGAKGGDGTLRLSFVGEPRSLNPNLWLDEHAMLVGQNLFSKLVSLAADGSLLPDLAERWDESPDGLTYTFHLRPGVVWHDGYPLTARDVRQTFVRMAEESSNREIAGRIAEVTALDDRTVTIRLREPWAAFLPTLGWFGTSILPAHLYGTAAWQDHPANLRPIGTGPFKLRSWDAGRRLVLEKNDEYFGPGPYVDRVEYLFTESPEEAADLLVSGKSDLLVGRPPVHQVGRLSREPGLRLITSPADARSYLGLNLRRRPFQDLRVRRAMNLAIDRAALVDRALAGIGTPAVGFYTPTIGWAYNGNARAPLYDRAEARALFAKALPPGFKATLVCPMVGSVNPLANEVVRQFEDAGLRVEAQCVPPQQYFERVFTTRDFDLVLMAGSQGPDPDNMAARFASTGAFQFMGYANAELDAELSRAARNSDAAIRASAYHRAQEILAADLPIVPLVESIRVTLVRDGLRGLAQDDARGLIPEHTYSLIRLHEGGR